MSNYAKIMPNDVVDGEGISVSFWVQGCPHHCHNCFNTETWDFNGGIVYTSNTKQDIIHLIQMNNISRNFSVLGGEPLAPQNLQMVEEIICSVRTVYPKINIYLWTGYYLNELNLNNYYIKSILENINFLIDGRFEEENKNLTLKLRGSSNQTIWERKNNQWIKSQLNMES